MRNRIAQVSAALALSIASASACTPRAPQAAPDPVAAWMQQGYTEAEARELARIFGRGPCIDYATQDGRPC